MGEVEPEAPNWDRCPRLMYAPSGVDGFWSSLVSVWFGLLDGHDHQTTGSTPNGGWTLPQLKTSVKKFSPSVNGL
jgi:hypothetical protein